MVSNTNKNKINDTFAEISIKALKENFKTIRGESNKQRKRNNKRAKVCSIVKANGYGHGMLRISEELVKFGTNYLGTADYSESVVLRDYMRKRKIKNVPILCLGNLSKGKKHFENILSRNIEVTISDVKIAKLLNNFAKSENKKVKIHIHVDTGMNRVGFKEEEVSGAVRELARLKNLEIKGIYSHFTTSELVNDPFVIKQLISFKRVVKEIEENIMKFELKHMENTGGIVNYRDEFFNMVRPGISLYGYFPDRGSIRENVQLLPVMTLKSKVSFIKELDQGKSISYGRNYFTKNKTHIASVPIGYGDGYSRILSNKSKVLINNSYYGVVGSVCMDWIMIDLGGINSGVKVNDEVILMGREYPAYNLAEITKTIPYEITCNISSRVQRVYV
jgi:alanine racemase